MQHRYFSEKLRSFPPSFWRLHLVLPLLLGLLLAFVYPHTSLDTVLIQPFFDAKSMVFPLRNDWFLENVIHLWLKYLMVGISLFMLLLHVLAYLPDELIPNHTPIKRYRRQFLWIFVAMLISTSIISILKYLSIHACPWDLTTYGGYLPHIPLFDSLPQGVKPGRCFPGGHASGGFALMAFYFGFRDTEPTLAKAGLLAGLVLGLVMSWGQMMRGAHFMSHNLWTAWLVWMSLLLLYLIYSPQKTPRST